MATISFEQLRFQKRSEGVRIVFMKRYYVDIPTSEAISVKGNSITFEKMSEGKARQKVLHWLGQHQQTLVNSLNGKPTAYVHRLGGLPLMGNVAFGIVDRGTNVVEVKPVTSCNIKCVFCSVDEDVRPVDFVVEREYMMEEFASLATLKGSGVEVLLGVQGEAFLYPELCELIADMRALPNVERVSLITNGSFLTEKMIGKLEVAGLTRLQVSINALDAGLARKIADAPYDVRAVLHAVERVANTSMDVMIVPVYVPGMNDEEIPKICAFAKRIGAGKQGPAVGLQNYLPYRFGKDPGVKPVSMDSFGELLKRWETETRMKLVVSAKELGIEPRPSLPLPMKRGEIIRPEIWGRGRLQHEWLAVWKGRSVSFFAKQPQKRVTLKVTRTKHNIFAGTLI